jgi:GNAT superfamily N-acetyltransferase
MPGRLHPIFEMPEHLAVEISKIDTERFGIRTARAFMSLSTVDMVIDYCREHNVQLLIARCNVTDMKVVHKLESNNFLLMDTLVYYSRSLVDKSLPDMSYNFNVRPVHPGDEDKVKAIALESFSAYIGHYHCDENLDKKTCDEIYPDWAYRSCTSRSVVDEVLVAVYESSIVGFLTLKLNNMIEAEGLLNGVLPEVQKRGVYTCLLTHAMRWSQNRGAERFVISTQLSNSAPQKIWTRLGFEFSHAFYTFHKWFDR